MKYVSKVKAKNSSTDTSIVQDLSHQQTMDYLQKDLKEISIQNQPQKQKYKMIAIEKNTPLEFKASLGIYGFLISYKKNEVVSACVKIVLMVLICGLMTMPLFYYSQLGQSLRFVTICFMYSIPFLYTLLFFLDPGTVFDDEQETFSQERIFCMTCEVYRNRSTKHCSFCNRCCKKYDHHCSVFGKCIGKRNLVFFYLFILNISLTFLLYFLASVGQMYGQFDRQSKKE